MFALPPPHVHSDEIHFQASHIIISGAGIHSGAYILRRPGMCFTPLSRGLVVTHKIVWCMPGAGAGVGGMSEWWESVI